VRFDSAFVRGIMMVSKIKNGRVGACRSSKMAKSVKITKRERQQLLGVFGDDRFSMIFDCGAGKLMFDGAALPFADALVKAGRLRGLGYNVQLVDVPVNAPVKLVKV